VVHGDLKPASLLLTRPGRAGDVKVANFGLTSLYCATLFWDNLFQNLLRPSTVSGACRVQLPQLPHAAHYQCQSMLSSARVGSSASVRGCLDLSVELNSHRRIHRVPCT
jgi:serine/threonine protein kinase